MYIAFNKNNPNEAHSFHWTNDNKLIICGLPVNPNDWEILEMVVVPERVPERVPEKKRVIQSMLISKFSSIGMDIPNNMDEIVEFCYQDVCATADETNWHDGDVAIALRRWMEQEN